MPRHDRRYTAPFRITIHVLTLAMTLSGRGESMADALSPTRGIKVGAFPAEVRVTYTARQGLPGDNVRCVAVDRAGVTFAGTPGGLARHDNGEWKPVPGCAGQVSLIATHGDALIGIVDGKLFRVTNGKAVGITRIPEEIADGASWKCLAGGDKIRLGTNGGLFEWHDGHWARIEELDRWMDADKAVRQVAIARDGRIAVATNSGAFVFSRPKGWQRVLPRQGDRSWAPHDVRGVTFDRHDRFWLASPQGVGVRDARGWRLYTGDEGLPYNDFTTMAAGEDGVVWFGTTRGAIRFDGQHWEYRAAPRWLPDNNVHDLAVSEDGTAWFATAQGLGVIQRRPMTLGEKAEFFEAEIDKYHRRTPYGFVHSVRLQGVDDKRQWTQHDSDNDGLWTAMYGAGECFAYAATKDQEAKRRACAAFEALRFLSQVTQGGSHPAPKGFPARTVLPTSGPDPNESPDTPQRDRQQQKFDPLWKVIVPRWPTSADGKWYWKCDTSSDELDGHYFFYAAYYDLVAESEAEKQRVRDVVVAITDHLVEHNFELIDHDGRPTRWGRFSPEMLNGDVLEGARGLNSLSILSYLKVAEHMTADPRYRKAYDTLVEDHSYATNTLDPKRRNGPGTGNQSDDEMAFMGYYNLLRYETDPRRRRQYLWSLRWYWLLEEPERCPLFNFIYGAFDDGSAMAALRAPDSNSYLGDAVDTLKRIPLDRVLWSYDNRHRIDIVRIPDTRYRMSPGGHLRNGRVLPIDERGLEHWNQDPWRLVDRHDGKTLTDGAAFLLPYYLGVYQGFIAD